MDYFFKEAGKFNVLTKKQSLELAISVREGDKKARELLINSNLRFVVTIAKQYKKRFPYASLEDLIASGNIGLVKAVDKFEPSYNNAFTTYAQFWIRDEICKELNIDHDIRIPKSAAKKVGKTMNTIASSIDDENFHETAAMDSYIYDVEESVGNKFLSIYINEALSNLNKKESMILRLHYGIDCDKKSLNEIGKLFGNVSKQTIRTWEVSALKKMRSGTAGNLEIYLRG